MNRKGKNLITHHTQRVLYDAKITFCDILKVYRIINLLLMEIKYFS